MPSEEYSPNSPLFYFSKQLQLGSLFGLGDFLLSENVTFHVWKDCTYSVIAETLCR
jgi:hypothetical protein